MTVLQAIWSVFGLCFALAYLSVILGWGYLLAGALLGACFGVVRSVKKNANRPCFYGTLGALGGALITLIVLMGEIWWALANISFGN